jgi:hypothetical protein
MVLVLMRASPWRVPIPTMVWPVLYTNGSAPAPTVDAASRATFGEAILTGGLAAKGRAHLSLAVDPLECAVPGRPEAEGVWNVAPPTV